MDVKTLFAATVLTGAAITNAASAATIEVVSGGSATFQITTDLGSLALGTNAQPNADGLPEFGGSVRATEQNDDGTLSGSQLVNGGAVLSVRGRGTYLFPLDSAGEEVESFDTVKVFNFREDDPIVSDEMKQINYVPTADPNTFTDYKAPGTTYTLTDEQVALLEDTEIRSCCRHTLSGFEINTADMTVDGVIDNITERDINFDGVIDENDEFHMFDLLEASGEGVFNLALTATFADFLNFGFSALAFEDPSEFLANWAGSQLTFAAGDIIGNVSYSYETAFVESVAPVPLPAALPLMIGGLGMLGVVATKRRRKAV